MTASDMRFDPNKTWVTVSAAIVAFMSLSGAIVWCTATYTSQSNFNSAMLTKLSEMKESIDRLANDGVSFKTFQQWIELLKARNPSIAIPDAPR